MPKIEVNNKIYDVILAITDEEKEKGLQGISELQEDQGMLFCYEEPTSVNFWMKDCNIALDIIFIDEYGEVISVVTGKPNDESPLEESNVKYVLEVNALSEIQAGDDIDLSEIEESEESEETKKMIVLDENGEVQMELEGGERIFSRPHTRILVNLSKKAIKSKKDKDYEALGKKVFQFIEKQNTQEPQFTKLAE